METIVLSMENAMQLQTELRAELEKRIADEIHEDSKNTTPAGALAVYEFVLAQIEKKECRGFKVVEELPDVNDAETNLIYLIRELDDDQNFTGFYSQWIVFDNNWEQIGTTHIDLDDFYNKTEIQALLAEKAEKVHEHDFEDIKRRFEEFGFIETAMAVNTFRKFIAVGNKVIAMLPPTRNSTTGLTSIPVLDLDTMSFSLIGGLPSRTYSVAAVVGNKVVLGAKNTLDVFSYTSIPVLDLDTMSFSLVEGLPSRTYIDLVVVGNKVVLGSLGYAHDESIPVLDLDTMSFSLTEGLPPQPNYAEYTNLVVVGNKVVVILQRFGANIPGVVVSMPVLDLDTMSFSLIEEVPSNDYSWSAVVGNKVVMFPMTTTTLIPVLDLDTMSFSLIEGLPSRTYSVPAVVGNKVVTGSRETTTSIPVLDLDTMSFSLIEGLPSRTYIDLAVVGNKVVSSVINDAVVVIFPDTMSFSLIEGLPSATYISGMTAIVENKVVLGNYVSGQSLSFLPVLDLDTMSFSLIEGWVPFGFYLDYEFAVVGNKVVIGITSAGLLFPNTKTLFITIGNGPQTLTQALNELEGKIAEIDVTPTRPATPAEITAITNQVWGD